MEIGDRLIEWLQDVAGNVRGEIGGVAAPLLAGAGVLVLLAVFGWVAVRVRPRRRIGYAMVPDPNFDPSLEEVVRWSAGLAAARAAVGWGSDSHRMVRLTFCSDPEGNLVSLIGLNPRARSVAERNGFAGVELADAVDVLGDRTPSWLPKPPSEAAPAPDPAVHPAPGFEADDQRQTPASAATPNSTGGRWGSGL